MEGGYVTIDSIVRSLLADEGYNTLHYYLRYLHFALEGEKDWRTDYGVEVRTEELQVNPDMTVDFPRDMIGWSKLGLLVGDKLVAFTRDSTLLNDPECLNEPRQPFAQRIENVKSDYYAFNNYYGNYDGNRLVAPIYATRLPGYFIEDYQKKRFVLSDEVKAKTVYLEYIPDKASCGASAFTMVHNVAEKLIKYYIQWKYACNKFGPESARAQAWNMQYLNEMDDVNARMSPLDYETILQTTRKYFTSGLNP